MTTAISRNDPTCYNEKRGGTTKRRITALMIGSKMRNVFINAMAVCGAVFATILQALIALALFATSAFVPVWTDDSEYAKQTAGVTVHYGLPLPFQHCAGSGRISFELGFCFLFDLIFWAAVVAGAVTFLCHWFGKERLHWRKFITRWVCTLIAVLFVAVYLWR